MMEIYIAVGFAVLGMGFSVYKAIENRGNKSMLAAVITGLESGFHAMSPTDVRVLKAELKYASNVFAVVGQLDKRVHELRKGK